MVLALATDEGRDDHAPPPLFISTFKLTFAHPGALSFCKPVFGYESLRGLNEDNKLISTKRFGVADVLAFKLVRP